MKDSKGKTGFILLTIFTIILLAATAAALLYIFDIISFGGEDTKPVVIIDSHSEQYIKVYDENGKNCDMYFFKYIVEG